MENKLKSFSKKAKLLKLGEYEHYKGHRYRVLYIGRDSDTLEEMVVYQGLYKDKPIWTKNLGIFLEKVIFNGKKVPRFKYIDDKNLKDVEEWTRDFIKRYRKALEALAQK